MRGCKKLVGSEYSLRVGPIVLVLVVALVAAFGITPVAAFAEQMTEDAVPQTTSKTTPAATNTNELQAEAMDEDLAPSYNAQEEPEDSVAAEAGKTVIDDGFWTSIQVQQYDGTPKTPKFTISKYQGDLIELKEGVDFRVLRYNDNVDVGYASVDVQGIGAYTGTHRFYFQIVIGNKPNTVAYRTHVQKDGWQNFVASGDVSGTSGQFKRLEGIKIVLANRTSYGGSIEYRTHVQKEGWQKYVKDGELSGTNYQAKRLEAIQIRLTGEMGEAYDVWYRVHAQTYGWLGWAKNDSPAGTAGLAKRLEAIQIQILPKGSLAPGEGFGAFVTKDGSTPDQLFKGHQVLCKTHVQTYGWQDWVADGQTSGTTGLAKRLEGINIKLNEQPVAGSIEYQTHVQTYGWRGYSRDGALSGTTGEFKRLEAIQIRLTGDMRKQYDVWYRVHAQTFGWMGWAKNDQRAGTAGFAKRLEGIQILVLPKGSPAPGSTANAYRQR